VQFRPAILDRLLQGDLGAIKKLKAADTFKLDDLGGELGAAGLCGSDPGRAQLGCLLIGQATAQEKREPNRSPLHFFPFRFSLKAIATACLRDFTFGPVLLPLRSCPCLNSRIVADILSFLTMEQPPINAKLDERDIKAIKILLAESVGLSTIGRAYGVTPQAIYRIKTKKTWSHE
jgi:hypothetical protein